MLAQEHSDSGKKRSCLHPESKFLKKFSPSHFFETSPIGQSCSLVHWFVQAHEAPPSEDKIKHQTKCFKELNLLTVFWRTGYLHYLNSRAVHI